MKPVAIVRTVRPLDDMPEVKRVGGFLIEQGIPLKPSSKRGAKMLTVLLALEPGESFIHTKRVKPGNFKQYLGERHFAVRSVAGGFRCWRLK